MSLHEEEVEVDGMDGVPHHGETHEHEQRYGLYPLVCNEGDDERFGKGREQRHDGKDDEGRHLQHLAIATGKRGYVVLYLTQYREGDTLYDVGALNGRQTGITAGTVVEAQFCLGEELTNNDGSNVGIHFIEQGGEQHLVAKAPLQDVALPLLHIHES